MSKRKILVVDDDPQFGAMVKLTLEQTGDFEVGVESESIKAIDTAHEFGPELILLDIVMPGLDGGDVEHLLREDPDLKDVPVLIVSAVVSEADAGEDGLVRTGDGDVMLPKTVSPPLLIKCMEMLLCGKSPA